jgi:CheY-like chemotaxis protein
MINKKILIVEDQEILKQELHTKIEAAGYEVLDVSNGDDALHLILTDHPDCVLLDISLPTINGLEVLKLIRQSGEFGNQVPVILLTNLSMSDDMLPQLTVDHPSFYLVKADTSLDTIVEKINECLGDSSSTCHIS